MRCWPTRAGCSVTVTSPFRVRPTVLAVFTMIVTPFEPVPGYPERLQSQADSEGLTRSPGLHLSTIYRDIERTIKPKDEWCTQEELEMFGAVGFMWERVYSMAHR